ncbi:phosphate ABC transporter permease PstA [Mycetocola reblochoni]|uniref:Phosphate transport system permease protein PstA n=2 Tax=Mycetocola reblochoni TaxID=331618 RepID=A0A1R4IR42_9MICO|nr:phosphate ABC transporter permease PstA [Mycetocola reblochoni]RLP69294.1 phosphate ABC transporter permease PstA [Mycetocola reblochoni]SJN22179.1 Phosphate transport system permease protein PstA (TC 3.A.1.7.1) [Mycetocola reblochoni REB411]
MTQTMTPAPSSTGGMQSALTASKLPRWVPAATLVGSVAVVWMLFALMGTANLAGVLVVSAIVFSVVLYALSLAIEGRRKAADRIATILVGVAFLLALIPLISVFYTALTLGAGRFDAEFFSSSMRNVVGAGGGAIHAITGTVLITLATAVISIPIGMLTAIYLVEYGTGKLKAAITFLVDVMTGIPSIVAGLFAYALLSLFLGPGVRMGIGGAIALSVLMIPVVVRSTEEMLKLVPNELREASYALGVPKYLTILKVVLPTSIAGIVTGAIIAIARVIGETAPLLIIAGFTTSMNYDLFSDRMMTLPVFAYTQYAQQGADAQAYIDRAWTAALALILIVMALNLVGRLIAKLFSPKLAR